MDDRLQTTLAELLRSGDTANPALNRLLSDFAMFHVVLVVVGGSFLVAFSLLSVWSGKRFRRSPGADGRRCTFERKTYLFFAMSSAAVGLVLALIVAANVSNAVQPRQGFSGVVGSIGTAPVGTPTALLHESFTTWLQSGRVDLPPLVHEHIDERLAWQRPKAIICGLLLLAVVALARHIWRALIRRSRVRVARWSLGDTALLGAGVGSGVVCLLLMLMVMGNAQGALVPLPLTLAYG